MRYGIVALANAERKKPGHPALTLRESERVYVDKGDRGQGAYVRFGSLTEVTADRRHVCFTLGSGHPSAPT